MDREKHFAFVQEKLSPNSFGGWAIKTKAFNDVSMMTILNLSLV